MFVTLWGERNQPTQITPTGGNEELNRTRIKPNDVSLKIGLKMINYGWWGWFYTSVIPAPKRQTEEIAVSLRAGLVYVVSSRPAELHTAAMFQNKRTTAKQ